MLDLPGHGDLPAATDYRYPALVEDAVRRTRDLGPFPLIGWSVGAAVAWLFAARHPERVRLLILIEPAAPHQSRFRHGPVPDPVHPFTYAGASKAADALRGIDPTITLDDIEALYRINSAGRWEPRFDPACLPVLVEEARDHGEEYYFELENVRVPTLIIFGERTFLAPREREEIASGVRSARVETVSAAGHFLVHEKPRETAALAAGFIDDNSA